VCVGVIVVRSTCGANLQTHHYPDLPACTIAARGGPPRMLDLKCMFMNFGCGGQHRACHCGQSVQLVEQSPRNTVCRVQAIMHVRASTHLVCVCVCVCPHVCVCVCLWLSVCACACMLVRAQALVQVRVRACEPWHAGARTHVQAFICVAACRRACRQACWQALRSG
jgi:hypothetical protein